MSTVMKAFLTLCNLNTCRPAERKQKEEEEEEEEEWWWFRWGECPWGRVGQPVRWCLMKGGEGSEESCLEED